MDKLRDAQFIQHAGGKTVGVRRKVVAGMAMASLSAVSLLILMSVELATPLPVLNRPVWKKCASRTSSTKGPGPRPGPGPGVDNPGRGLGQSPSKAPPAP